MTLRPARSVAGTGVRLDGVVGRLQKLPLDIFGSRTYVHVDARQILLCDRSNQPFSVMS